MVTLAFARLSRSLSSRSSLLAASPRPRRALPSRRPHRGRRCTIALATGLAGLLGSHTAHAAGALPVLALDGGISSSDQLPGTFQLRAGWMHTLDRFAVGTPHLNLGGVGSLRLGDGGARVAPLLRTALDWESFSTALELGPTLHPGSSLQPGGMAQLTAGFYGLQATVWAEQTTAHRAVGGMLGVDLVQAVVGVLQLSGFRPGGG